MAETRFYSSPYTYNSSAEFFSFLSSMWCQCIYFPLPLPPSPPPPLITSKLELRTYWLTVFSGHGSLNLYPAVSKSTLLHPLAAHVNQGQDRESQSENPLPSWSSVGAQQELRLVTMSFLRCCELDKKRKLSSVNFSACLDTVYGARITACSSLQWGTWDLCSSFPGGIYSISGCGKMYWRKHIR